MKLFLKGLGIVITILIVASFVFLLDYLNALGLLAETSNLPAP